MIPITTGAMRPVQPIGILASVGEIGTPNTPLTRTGRAASDRAHFPGPQPEESTQASSNRRLKRR